MKTLYGVMKIQNDLICEDGQVATLPEGVYYMPVFVDEALAIEHSCDGAYEIVELKSGRKVVN